MHAVVADLQCCNAGGDAFARFQFDQEFIGVAGQSSQLIEFGIEALGDDAAIALHHRRMFDHRARKQRGALAVFTKLRTERRQPGRIELLDIRADRRQRGQCVAQGGKIAWPGRTQRDAGQNPLDIADAPEAVPKGYLAAAFQQDLHGLQTLRQYLLVAQRTMQPASQQTATHGADGGVEHAQQRVLLAAIVARIELKMAARDRIHRDRVVGGLDQDRGEVRQLLLLRLLDITEQCPGCGNRERLVLDAETAQVVHAEKLQQLATAGIAVEIPGRASAQAGHGQYRRRPFVFVRHQHFRRRQSRELGGQLVFGRGFGHQETAARQICPGQAEALSAVGPAAARNRQQQGVASFLQQGFVGHCARRDDANDLALHQSLGQGGVADLLADGYRFAERHQARQVAFSGMHGHARHRYRGAARTAALGQCDVEQARGLARIVEK